MAGVNTGLKKFDVNDHSHRSEKISIHCFSYSSTAWSEAYSNLRSGVFFFFASFLLWLEREKNNALLPKTDYRDEGRGHDRMLEAY